KVWSLSLRRLQKRQRAKRTCSLIGRRKASVTKTDLSIQAQEVKEAVPPPNPLMNEYVEPADGDEVASRNHTPRTLFTFDRGV
ncbi:MAG: hypothetical protein AAFQ92_28570, partial [Bacteroidota bacterium]